MAGAPHTDTRSMGIARTSGRDSLQHVQAAQEAADNTGRPQNLIDSGVPGQRRMVEDDELRDWIKPRGLFDHLWRAIPRHELVGRVMASRDPSPVFTRNPHTWALLRRELLSRAIDTHGHGTRAFFRDVLGLKSNRNGWRWLEGEREIPDRVVDLCLTVVR